MNAQTKSPKIDRFIHLKLNHEYIKSSLGRGDGYSRAEDKYYEYKISTTNKDKNINALQIRIWQAVDFYILGYVDEEVFENYRLFKLSHEEMKNECVKFGLSATHGTREANLNNKNIELTFRLKMDFSNKEYLRFEKLYRDNDLEDKVFDGFR